MLKKILAAMLAVIIGVSASALAAPKDEVKEIFEKDLLNGTEKVEISFEFKDGTSEAVLNSDFGQFLSQYSFVNENKFRNNEDSSVMKTYETTTVSILGETSEYTSWLDKNLTANPPVYRLISRTTGDSKYTVYDYVKYGMAESIDGADSRFALDDAVVSDIANADIQYMGMYGEYTLTYKEDTAKLLLPVLEALLQPYLDAYLLTDTEGLVSKLATLSIFDATPLTKHIVCSFTGYLTLDETSLNFKFNVYDICQALGINPGSFTKEASDVALTMKVVKRNYDLNSKEELPFPALRDDNTININPRYAMGNVLFKDEINVFVDYNRVYFDVLPKIVEDRTLVPIRALANALGISNDNIIYDEKTENITIKNGKTTIKLTVGSNIAYINGEEKIIDVPANVYDDRTLLPLRFIAEAFECNVEWTEFSENGVQTGGIVDITTK